MQVIKVMNKKLITLKSKTWVFDPNEINSLIKTWWFIYTSGTKLLKNCIVYNMWAKDVKQFGNLYLYSMFSQLNNNVGSFNQLCHLKKTVKKLFTIHLQVETLLCFAYFCQI